MHSQRTSVARGVVVARGYGLKIRVDRGHLIVEDGVGRDRRMRRYNRASGRIRRLVVIGQSGYVSLDAIRWLSDVGAALVHLNASGHVLASSSSAGPEVPTLRRAQALATTNQTGIEIARELLREKVRGQASLLGSLPAGEGSRREIERALAEIETAGDMRGVLAAELRAAGAYCRRGRRSR